MRPPLLDRGALLVGEVVDLIDADDAAAGAASCPSTASTVWRLTPSRWQPVATVRRRSWITQGWFIPVAASSRRLARDQPLIGLVPSALKTKAPMRGMPLSRARPAPTTG